MEHPVTHIIAIALTAIMVGCLLALVVWAASLTAPAAFAIIAALALVAGITAYRNAA